MKPESEYKKLIESRGISLRSFGIADIALSRADAIYAVELLGNASIPILGGDVYFKKDTGIELAYANWHSDPFSGEDRHSFAARSCIETLNYIKSFPATEETPIFAFTIDEG